MKIVLCFREAARKRKAVEEPRTEGASFACFDMDLLYAGLRTENGCETPSPALCAGALSLLCAGWSHVYRQRGQHRPVPERILDELSDQKVHEELAPPWRVRLFDSIFQLPAVDVARGRSVGFGLGTERSWHPRLWMKS